MPWPDHPIPRRALLTLGIASLRDPAADPPSPAAPPAPPAPAAPAAVPNPDVRVDASACSGCGSCALACPTGALRRVGSDESAVMLIFEATACNCCLRCVDNCPEPGAIVLRVPPAPPAAGPVLLATVPVGRRCQACGTTLAGGPAASAVLRRLTESHPLVAERLRSSSLCPECALVGPAASGPATTRQGGGTR